MRAFVCTISALTVVVSTAAAKPVTTTHPFRISVTRTSPCTGEPTLVEIAGTVEVERSGGAGTARYLVSTRLDGVLTGQHSGTRFPITGAETVSFDEPSDGRELVVSTQTRVVAETAEPPVLGTDVETIKLGVAGEVTSVTNGFEFTCD